VMPRQMPTPPTRTSRPQPRSSSFIPPSRSPRHRYRDPSAAFPIPILTPGMGLLVPVWPRRVAVVTSRSSRRFATATGERERLWAGPADDQAEASTRTVLELAELICAGAGEA
jgi:hypothetical protein